MHKDLTNIAAEFIIENRSLVHVNSKKVFTRNDTSTLISFLYQNYYLRGAPSGGSSTSFRSIKEQEDLSITSTYYEALKTLTFPDSGWAKVSDGDSLFHKDGVTLRATTEQVSPEQNGRYCLKIPCARPYASAGFFSCYSSSGPLRKGVAFNRIYFNNKHEQVPEVFIKILNWANDNSLPLIIKAGNNKDTLRRPDSLVIYVQRDTFSRLSAAIQGSSKDTTATKSKGPAFTKTLTEGFYWAEDAFPFGASGLSFGKHRCQATALGMLAALTETGALEEGIAGAWETAGLNPNEPHLSPIRK